MLQTKKTLALRIEYRARKAHVKTASDLNAEMNALVKAVDSQLARIAVRKDCKV